MMPPSSDGKTTADLEFTLVRYLDAPRERVFRMWRDPQLFRAWSAPTGFRMSVCICDFQPVKKIRIYHNPGFDIGKRRFFHIASADDFDDLSADEDENAMAS